MTVPECVDYKIIIIDTSNVIYNGDSNNYNFHLNLAEPLKDVYKIKLLYDANEGFAKGYNTALRQVDAHYYVLLNSDVEVSDNWLEPIVSLMDSNKQIAACQPKILDYYHKNKFEYAGASGGFIDM